MQNQRHFAIMPSQMDSLACNQLANPLVFLFQRAQPPHNGDRLAQHMLACLNASIHMTKSMWFNNYPQFNLLFQEQNTFKLHILQPPFPINFLIFAVAPNFSVLINLPVSVSFNIFCIIPCSSNIFIPCSVSSITDFPLVLGQKKVKKKMLKD